MVSQPIRLNKFLAERLGCSRREADKLIESGQVLIGQTPASVGARVDENDKVWYNKKLVPFQAEYLYIAFHKPVGYVCSRRAQGSTPTLYDLVPTKYRNLKTVGRLDKDSSGLILLTNDGDFAFRMTHPKFRKTKVYEVELDHSLEPLHQQMISDYGVMLDDGVSKFKVITPTGGTAIKSVTSVGDAAGGTPARASARVGEAAAAGPAENKLGRTHFTVILTEVRNRQIRRTFAALGYRVTRLHRTSFGKYELGNLPSGKYAIIEP